MKIILVILLLNSFVIFSQNQLNLAESWIIENVNKFDYENKDSFEKLKNYMKDNFNIWSIHNFQINKNGHILFVVLNDLSDRSQIECFQRVTYDNIIYEYWVIRKMWEVNHEWNESLSFVITSTQSLVGVRTIIHKSDQFIEEYKISNDFIFHFDTSDWNLSKLRPWIYPDNFLKSDLDEYETYTIKNDNKYENDFEIEKITFGRKKLTENEKIDLRSNGGTTEPSAFDGFKGRVITAGIRMNNNEFESPNLLNNLDITYITADIEGLFPYNRQLFKPYFGHALNLDFKDKEIDTINYSLAFYTNSPIREFEKWYLTFIPVTRLGLIYNKEYNFGIRYDLIFPIFYGLISPYFSHNIYFENRIEFEYGVYFKIPVFLSPEIINKFL